MGNKRIWGWTWTYTKSSDCSFIAWVLLLRLCSSTKMKYWKVQLSTSYSKCRIPQIQLTNTLKNCHTKWNTNNPFIRKKWLPSSANYSSPEVKDSMMRLWPRLRNQPISPKRKIYTNFMKKETNTECLVRKIGHLLADGRAKTRDSLWDSALKNPYP